MAWIPKAGLKPAGLRLAGSDPATDSTARGYFASWTKSVVRYFLLDPVNGNDANLGYVDGTPDTATASSFAVKTETQLFSLIPPIGNARMFCILVAPGSSTLTWDFSQFTGYRKMTTRTTGTVSTAGSTLWGSTANDYIGLGWTTVSGSNTAGYHIAYTTQNVSAIAINADGSARCTIAGHGFSTGDKVWVDITGTSTTANIKGVCGTNYITVVDANTFDLLGTQCELGTGGYTANTVNVKRWKVTNFDGSAPNFGDNETGTTTWLGKRVRGDVATTTAGLRNSSRNIVAHAADTIIFGSDLAATPVAGDVFYIEGPAFTTTGDFIHGSALSPVGFASGGSLNLTVGNVTVAGIRFNRGGASGWKGNITLACCEFAGSCQFQSGDQLTVSSSYTDETGTTRTPGTGARFESLTVFNDIGALAASFFASLLSNNLMYVSDCPSISIGASSVCRCGLQIMGSGAGSGGITTAPNVFFRSSRSVGINSTTQRGLHVYAPIANPGYGLVLFATCLTVDGLEVVNDTFSACVAVAGMQNDVAFAKLFGSRNNTGSCGFDVVGGTTIPGNKNNFIGVLKVGTTPANAEKDTTCQIRGKFGDFRLVGKSGFYICQYEVIPHQGLKDVNDNIVGLLNANFGVSIRPSAVEPYTRQDGTTTLEKYQVVKSAGEFTIAKAQANTAANALAVVGVTVNDSVSGGPTSIPNGNNQPLVLASGEEWVIFDRSGAHPAPTPGTSIAYLAVDNPGLAQADVPAVAATNQKMRLGVVTGTHPTVTNCFAVLWRPDPYPTLADGNP